MFDLYFCPRVAKRLRTSPDADWLGSLLAVLHRDGYARLTVQSYLREAELFGRWLRRNRRSLATLTDADVRAFATRPPLRRLRCNARSAGHHLLRHLRDRGLAPPRTAPASARIERVVAAYDAHLRDAAGLAGATRLYRRRYAREFLCAVFGTGPIRWPRLRSDHVREFVAGYGWTGRVSPYSRTSCRRLMLYVARQRATFSVVRCTPIVPPLALQSAHRLCFTRRSEFAKRFQTSRAMA